MLKKISGKLLSSVFFDTKRIYGVLPGKLRIRFWNILFLKTFTAIIESSTVVVISFFALSLSSPNAMREHFFFRLIAPYLPEYVAFRLKGDRTFITTMCLAVVFFIVLKNLMTFLSTWRTVIFSQRIGLYISAETLRRYFANGYLWHISGAANDMFTRFNFRHQLTTMSTEALQLFGNIICAIVMFTSLLIVAPKLTLTVICTFTIVCSGSFILLRKRVDRAGKEVADFAAREHRATNIAQRGIREIINFRKQDVFYSSIIATMREAVRPRAFSAISGAIPAWFLETAGFANLFGVMYVLVARGVPMPQIISSMSMLLLTAWRVLPSVSRIMNASIHIRGLRPMALSCLELVEGFSGNVAGMNVPPAADFSFAEALEIRNLTFRYPGSEEKCIDNLSLTIKKGQRIAFIGVSGAGKTTLALIVAGLIEIDENAYWVDSRALTPGRREALKQRVGLVPQNPLLLPGTLADNVALSRWGEKYDRAKVAQACKDAAMDFIQDNPLGIDLCIGEGGQGLSGGQAQRVAIARALFTEPEILIFDEATSALDQASENMIGETVKRLPGGVTSVIIAHRLTTVEDCDRVIWLQQGKIVADGAPASVLPHYIASLRTL